MLRSSRTALVILGGMLAAGATPAGFAQPLTIHQVQYTTNPGGSSDYQGQVIDCVGGVVVSKFRGSKPRLVLQDPNFPSAWGGIQVKDWTIGDLWDQVSPGDWVELYDVKVEEFVGVTFLQYQAYDPESSYSITSSGNPPPPAVELTCADLAHPANHSVTEQYESMAVTLRDVTVGQKDLGKANDNYELIQPAGITWGTDYMNVDAGAPYDQRIVTGAQLARITGMVEQYTRDEWDYYQLCTRSADDIVRAPVPAVSDWGLVIMALLTTVAGTVLLRRGEWSEGHTQLLTHAPSQTRPGG